MNFVAAHFARIGGVLLHPRATLERILVTREGNVLELVPWAVVVTMIIAPVEAGRAFLLFRVSLAEGAMSFLMLLSNRLSPALFGLVGAALLLHLLERLLRRETPRFGLESAIDAVAFTLVPYFALCVLGAVLSRFGLEFWWLPHRAIKGPPAVVWTRVLVAFAWPIGLYLVLARMWLRPRIVPSTSA